jgi:carbon starvation protein
MSNTLLANLFFTESEGRILLRAMPVLLCVLGVLAIAYRYYSAFLAAKVMALDDSHVTPAHRFEDGQNYDPTNKWVLFGHHFAAISGAGPLIGPVLAIQYGYMPGLLWLVIGVCLAGAVQDMLVLAASVRRGGKSLAEIAKSELGPFASIVVSAAILFIVVIALAGLGFVVVKALGGEEIKLAENTRITVPQGRSITLLKSSDEGKLYLFPGGCQIRYTAASAEMIRPEAFQIQVPGADTLKPDAQGQIVLPKDAVQVVEGSSWGTFTIAATIPIALFVGWYMYRLRKGKVLEASLIGAALVLGAVVVGHWIPHSPLHSIFSLTKEQTVFALTTYGFVAAVLPVWLLLCPRDYLSSFLKIGTIALLVVGVLLANPALQHPTVNPYFQHGGPTFRGNIFPFVFICIMCGAISGFHSLVSSGTTPKMIDKETHVRPIGYGAMLMEGLVGIMALIAASSMDVNLYFEINTDLRVAEKFQPQLEQVYAAYGGQSEAKDPLHMANVDSAQHLNLAQVETLVGNESLRGRTGGAVTLAVGMALIFTQAFERLDMHIEGIMAYWYHFAIMFEALFILTTIDAGTRIARFLLQEALGKVYPKFERTDWLPGALLATFVVTAGWGVLVWGGSINTIWPMFGIANQLLAVMALALITTLLINSERARYAPITLVPMLFVTTTTLSAGYIMLGQFLQQAQGEQMWTGILNFALTLFVIIMVMTLLLMAASRWVAVISGMIPARPALALAAEGDVAQPRLDPHFQGPSDEAIIEKPSPEVPLPPGGAT